MTPRITLMKKQRSRFELFYSFWKRDQPLSNADRYEQFNASHQLISSHSKVVGIKSNTSKSRHENNKETYILRKWTFRGVTRRANKIDERSTRWNEARITQLHCRLSSTYWPMSHFYKQYPLTKKCAKATPWTDNLCHELNYLTVQINYQKDTTEG